MAFRDKWKIERMAAGHCTGQFAFAELIRVFGPLKISRLKTRPARRLYSKVRQPNKPAIATVPEAATDTPGVPTPQTSVSAGDQRATPDEPVDAPI